MVFAPKMRALASSYDDTRLNRNRAKATESFSRAPNLTISACGLIHSLHGPFPIDLVEELRISSPVKAKIKALPGGTPPVGNLLEPTRDSLFEALQTLQVHLRNTQLATSISRSLDGEEK